jgi:phospholipid/cholesterol/gamma-HCH transport system substrate-binding protein
VKGLSAGLKVGILTLVVAFFGFWMWKQIGERASGEGGYDLWAQFRDAQGLASKSRVVIAGLTIGEIVDRRLEGRVARVTVKIRRGTEIWSNAIIFKKSSSLLGEFYLEIDPGTPESVSADGVVTKNHLLEPGDQIPNVVESTTTDEIMRSVGETLPRVDKALDEIQGLVADVRRLVNGQITHMADTLERDVSRDSELVNSILIKADRALGNIDGIVADVKKVTGNADDRVDKIFDNVETASSEAKMFMVEARQTGQAVRDKLDRLDKTLAAVEETAENTSSISKKIDSDQGTLGRLVNDPTIADNIADITNDAKSFTSGLFGLQTIVGMRGEYNFLARNYRSYVSVELHTRQDKFYLIEIVGDPRGDVNEHLEYDETNEEWNRTLSADYGYRFTFQLGKRYDWLGLRIGLKDSSGGVGADAYLMGDSLRATLDIFDFSYYKVPRVKLAMAYSFFRYLYVYAGVDDVLNPHTEVPIAGDTVTDGERKVWSFGLDFFAGAGLRFTDQDLTSLLFIGGSAIAGATK